MRARLDPIAWVMRVFPGDGEPPAPYVGSATVTVDLARVATIQGFTMAAGHRFTCETWRAVFAELARHGIAEATWIRMDRDADGTATARVVRERVPPLTEQRKELNMADEKKYKVTFIYRIEHQDAQPGDAPMFEIPSGMVWNNLDGDQRDFLSVEMAKMLMNLPAHAKAAEGVPAVA